MSDPRSAIQFGGPEADPEASEAAGEDHEPSLGEPSLRQTSDGSLVILPVPFERTTSYGQGTAGGPEALLRASHFIELYDEELDRDLSGLEITTAPTCDPAAPDLEQALGEIEREAERHLAAGKFLVTLGGEHSLSLAPVKAAQAVCGELGVVQFDAHADLRDRYEGSPFSHACVMRRILECGVPSLAVGVRAISGPERRLVERRRLPVLWGHELEQAEGRFESLLAGLPERVYLTFDVDFFDPSLLPATGTPEPGGGFWYDTLRLVRRVFERKTVVAMDVVELAPIPGQPASDFVAAKLVMKALAYRSFLPAP
ncbi:MAG: agmatinase [Acidobacteriota bacterium]